MTASPLAPGTTFGGDFVIVRPLSAGGMGAVYVARQKSTGKDRALKVMHLDLLQNAQLRARFEQEARVGSLLASDHVAEVLAAGVDETTQMPWLAMELLEGEDLAAYLRRNGPLGPPETFEILRQACHALAAAHAVGVVHRDIKPENVFLARTRGVSASLTVKLLDFGVAKILAAAQSFATSTVGTPLWMAPEQTESTGIVGPPSDVWALGLLAFWMLTGRWFWLAMGTGAPSMPMLLREILMDPIPKASERAAALGAGERIPPGFDAWFERCTARDASARYPNAAEAIAGLQAHVFGGRAVTPMLPPRWSGVPAASNAPPEAFADTSRPITTPPAHGGEPGAAPKGGPTAPRASSRAPLVALVVLTLGGLIATTLFVVLRQRDDTTPTPSASASAAGTTTPSSTVSGKRATVVPSTHPSAQPRPFDRAAADTALQVAGQRAQARCKGKPGPTSVRVEVTLINDGTVRRATTTDGLVASTNSALCVTQEFFLLRVPPFDGPEVTLTWPVGL